MKRRFQLRRLGFDVLCAEPEEGGYSVIGPSLPGCVTQGETVDEALADACEAVEGHVASLEELGAEVAEEDIPSAVVTFEIETRKQALAWRMRARAWSQACA